MATTSKEIITWDTETEGLNPLKHKIVGWSWSKESDSGFEFGVPKEKDFEGKYVVAHNGGFDAKMCYFNLGFKPYIDFDTQTAYYLLHPDRANKLEIICKDLWGEDKKDLMEVYNDALSDNRKTLPEDFMQKILHSENGPGQLSHYATEDAVSTSRLYEYCKGRFSKNPLLKKWFEEIEMPLANIVTESEIKGIKVDTKYLKSLETEWQIRRDSLLNSLRVMSGEEELNPNSSIQLQKILFKKLKLPKTKKTKTGWSTQTKYLEPFKERSGFVRKLLEYKELEKLLNSFVRPLPTHADGNDRIHCNFNLTLTATRRMSCSGPNLQQIPSKTENGRKIRRAFVAKPGHKIVGLDFSQIELRILAHFSQEPNLIRAFEQDLDLHSYTASLMFGTPYEEVTDDERYICKTINFSIIYGKTVQGFSQDWNCTKEHAEKQLAAWFNAYPGVKKYIDVRKARAQASKGWIKDIAGLPLYVPNICSSDTREYEKAGRQAVNYEIQGSAGSLFKKSAVDVYSKLGHVPLIYCHDELLFEIKEDEVEVEAKKIQQVMESCWPSLTVPLKVSVAIGDWWSK